MRKDEALLNFTELRWRRGTRLRLRRGRGNMSIYRNSSSSNSSRRRKKASSLTKTTMSS